MTFSILSVCTGNICRSPLAELILADALTPLGDVTVESAGTGALLGSGVPDQIRQLAQARGIDTSSHRARQIDGSIIRGADLVLAMSRDHRRLIVETLPAAMRRAFTLRELARIAEEIEPGLADAVTAAGARTPEEGMRAAVSYAATLRGTVPPPASPDEFDIVDPFRKSDEIYAESFEQLSPAADRVASFLAAGARVAASN